MKRIGEAAALCLITGLISVGLTLLEEEARHRAKRRRKQAKKAEKVAK